MSLVKWDSFREFTAFNDRLGHFLGRNWDRARLTGDELRLTAGLESRTRHNVIASWFDLKIR